VRAPDFARLSVAVAGDLIADRYLLAEPKALSREAPVIVLREVSERLGAGGAANVARNLLALGARTRVLGAVGRDARGRELVELLEGEGVDVGGIASVPGWSTPTKTRVLAAEPRRSLQQVLRLDRDPQAPVPGAVRAELGERVARLAGEVDALVLSDYDYGLLDEGVARAAARLADAGATVVLDPRSRLAGFEGLSALTPNVPELARFTGRAPEALADPGELARAAGELLERARPRWLLVTRGNSGMALFGAGLPEAGVAVEASGTGNVTDVTGAGDTAAAVFALALAAGEAPIDAMLLANAASGVVVLEHGAAVCTPEALRAAMAAAPPAVLAAGGAR
jgi:rfaE bifunctional protein kinase chain/domain